MWSVELRAKVNLWCAAVAASAPSEEGAGAPKGFRGATEGERTRGCYLHQGVDIHKVIQVSLLFSVRLYILLSHILGVSLLPSACSNPLCRHPPPSSEGGEGTLVPCAELTHCGKEDSNERNPSGVSFVLVQVAFVLQRRGEGAPAPCSDSVHRGAENALNLFCIRGS